MNVKLITLSNLIKFKESLTGVINSKISELNTELNTEINTKVNELNTTISTGLATKSDTGHRHDNATTSKDGFMSSSDKVKLNGITKGNKEGNVPVIGTSFGTTNYNIVVTDQNGYLKSFGKDPSQIGKWGNGGAICNTAANTERKEVSISGFGLYTGMTIKVMFVNGNSISNPTLNINNTGAKKIKVVKAGAKINPPVHKGRWRGASSETIEVWQPFTTLELMYDGTEWIIIGNPVVEDFYSETGGYTLYANGLIMQWGRIPYPRGDTTVTFTIRYTSNLSYSILLAGAAGGPPAYYYAYEPNQMKINMLNVNSEICWMTIGY